MIEIEVPMEVCELILSFLDRKKDRDTLRNTALVSRSFLEATRRFEFYELDFVPFTKDPPTVGRDLSFLYPHRERRVLHNLLWTRPEIKLYIRKLSILWPTDNVTQITSDILSVLRLLAGSRLSLTSLTLHGCTFHHGPRGLFAGRYTHTVAEEDVLVKLIKASPQLESLHLSDLCVLIPLEIIAAASSHIKNVTIHRSKGQCPAYTSPSVICAASARRWGVVEQKKATLERLELRGDRGYLQVWMAKRLSAPDFPVKFTRLKEVFLYDSGSKNLESLTGILSSCEKSLEFLGLGVSQLPSFSIQRFRNLKSFYVHENVSPKPTHEAYEFEGLQHLPSRIQRFGVYLDLFYWTGPTMDQAVQSRLEHLDIFIAGLLHGREDLKCEVYVHGLRDEFKVEPSVLQKSIQGWLPVLGNADLLVYEEGVESYSDDARIIPIIRSARFGHMGYDVSSRT